MERDWLEARLAEGRSIESIAREVGKHPSTVGYWVKKHDLRSEHAAKHAARGGIDRETLLELVERGMSVRQIGEEIGLAYTSVRHWLAKYGLQSDPLQYARSDREKPASVPRECPRHGWTDYVRSGARGFYRCPRCSMERVAARRRRIKEILVAEAGGRCRVCGYDIYIGALQFHHQDPTAKRFTVSRGGTTGSLDSMREEARKCVLLCANCHAEVEAGLVLLASPADNPG
jgi:transposase